MQSPKKNYIVHGIRRRSSSINTERINHLHNNKKILGKRLFLHYADLVDARSMEKIIKEMTAQRNYDIEQINKGNNIRASATNNTWLDTKMGKSIKSEAINKTTQDNIITKPGTKYIKIDNNDIELSDAKLNAINLSFYANDLIEPNEGEIFKKITTTPDHANELINAQCLITTLDAKVNSLSEELKTVNDKLDKLCNILLKNEMK